jgi:hypothetical protein
VTFVALALVCSPHLATHWQTKDDSPAVIVGASSSFPDDAQVQVNVFKLLNTCVQSPADQLLFVEAGAIEAAAVALTRHRSDADVARAVCIALPSLLMGSNPNQERAAALGLIESVMAVFAEHPVTHEDVSRAAGRMISGRSSEKFVSVRACDAIMALVCEHPVNQERAGAAGACEVIVKLLQVRFLPQMDLVFFVFLCPFSSFFHRRFLHLLDSHSCLCCIILQDFASDDDVMINASQAFFFLLSYPMSDQKKLHRANQNRFLAAGAGAAIEVALAVPACEMSELLQLLKALLATPAVEGV